MTLNLRRRQSPVLSNSANWRNLPGTVSTLYVLARLEHPVLEDALRAGTVHPGMTCADADELLEAHRARPPLAIEDPVVVMFDELWRAFAEFCAEVIIERKGVSPRSGRRPSGGSSWRSGRS